MQYYQPDNYSYYRRKSLMLKKEKGDYKVFAEQWVPLGWQELMDSLS